jgi:hypothetical protein
MLRELQQRVVFRLKVGKPWGVGHQRGGYSDHRGCLDVIIAACSVMNRSGAVAARDASSMIDCMLGVM